MNGYVLLENTIGPPPLVIPQNILTSAKELNGGVNGCNYVFTSSQERIYKTLLRKGAVFKKKMVM